MTVKFSDEPDRVCEVERIDDELIDELFYQEDEIGEFRHYAFMIECGLEEEDWSGPDIDPIPWPGNSDSSSSSDGSTEKKPEVAAPVKVEEEPTRKNSLQRMHSSDDVVEREREAPARPEPRRGRLVAAKSGTLHGMRTTKKEANDEEKPERSLRSPPTSRKLVAAKSGTLHGMRQAAANAAQGTDSSDADKSAKREPKRGSLSKTRSGSGNNLRRRPDEDTSGGRQRPLRRSPPVRSDSMSKQTIADAISKATGTDDVSDDQPKKPTKAPRVRPVRTIAPSRVKSGTMHTMRRPRIEKPTPAENEAPEPAPEPKTDSVVKRVKPLKRISDTNPKMATRQPSADSTSDSEDEGNNSSSSSSVSISSDSDSSEDGGLGSSKGKTVTKSSNSGSSRITIKKDDREASVTKSANGGKSRITIQKEDKPGDGVTIKSSNGGSSRVTIKKETKEESENGKKVTTRRVANGGRSRIIIVKDKKPDEEKKPEDANPSPACRRKKVKKNLHKADPNLPPAFRSMA